MHSATLALGLSAFVAVATALRIVSDNPAFPAAGRQGCITASSNTTGAAVVIQDCTNLVEQDWTFVENSAPQQLRVLGDKCVDVIDGNNADGAKLQIWTCVAGNTNQLFIPVASSTYQWAGTNKCIDLTDGNINNGNQLQVWTCDPNNSNQRWTASSSSPPPPVELVRFQLATVAPQSSLCIGGASSDVDGTTVTLASCGDLNTVNWILPPMGANHNTFTGQIKSTDGKKCLDVRDGNPTNGGLVQIWSCTDGNTNQLWQISKPEDLSVVTISWVGQNKCVDVKDGVYAPGTALQMWDCDSNSPNPSNLNQLWNPLFA
ncbi:hypothetical protein E1B28_012022 [Marasmius oreades]|uniref:Ricin B lectin domain-containing protein n=1 Tax=Marasmius oreades TaxID=181124 RepID=A0A9P7RR71_9AGAR|nr:uncharacterized protein E1B28_012022 [Marasmius oreades]KAG7087982.1 hypothetical protein E1B28_012022 [Marasmius oreades]